MQVYLMLQLWENSLKEWSQKHTQTQEYKLKVAQWMWFNARRGAASDANYITSKTEGLDWRMEMERERVEEEEEVGALSLKEK